MLPMLKTILASLFKAPATIPFPHARRIAPGPLRGKVVLDRENCIFCGICGRCCPTGAIAVDRREKAWAVDPFGCVQCGYCVEACPKKCLGMSPELPTPGKRVAKEGHSDARIPDNA